MDLVAALVHEIEAALLQGRVATFTAADVQGAFDTVMRNRQMLRMRQQGWPDQVVQWVGSFMKGRAARVRLQETLTEMLPLTCGLPQGSPASPILFLLYTEPMYRIGQSRPEAIQQSVKQTVYCFGQRFGYADDIGMLQVADTLGESAKMATADLAALIDWGKENAVTFDPDKTEVMHFSRRRVRTYLRSSTERQRSYPRTQCGGSG